MRPFSSPTFGRVGQQVKRSSVFSQSQNLPPVKPEGMIYSFPAGNYHFFFKSMGQMTDSHLGSFATFSHCFVHVGCFRSAHHCDFLNRYSGVSVSVNGCLLTDASPAMGSQCPPHLKGGLARVQVPS